MFPTLFRSLLISVHILNVIGFLIWGNLGVLWLILVITIIGIQLKPRIILPDKTYFALAATIIILIGIFEYGIYIGNWISDPYAEIGFPTFFFILLLFEPKTKKTLLTQPPTESSKTKQK